MHWKFHLLGDRIIDGIKNYNHDFDIPSFFGPIINYYKSHLDFSCISLSISKIFWSPFLWNHIEMERWRRGKNEIKQKFIQIFTLYISTFWIHKEIWFLWRLKNDNYRERKRNTQVSLYVKSEKKWCKWIYLENGNRLTGWRNRE